MKITKESFGKTTNDEVDIFTLSNNNGMEVKITNYGGIVTSIITPGKSGNLMMSFNFCLIQRKNRGENKQTHP